MRLELTKPGDQAVRAMVALVSAPDGTLLSVRRMADEMGIPVRFLPQVMGDLARAGHVTSASGRAGGDQRADEPAPRGRQDAPQPRIRVSRRRSRA